MASRRPTAHTVGSRSFDPDAFFDAWAKEPSIPKENDLRVAILTSFNILESDRYIYHATASVTLAQVQGAIEEGGKHGLHAWYLNDEGKPLPPPPPADIQAYTSIFNSTKSAANQLKSLGSNAKKGSLRASIASYLSSKRTLPSTFVIPKKKHPLTNPYYDLWAWSCANLEWIGPNEGTVNVRQSHHILPVFMHHFGCVVPSHESLEVIKQVASGRRVIDLGSGNGYWTYMLRRTGLAVEAVDNMQSEWRTVWVPDTIVVDGVKHLRSVKGGRDAVLLLVYPVVGADFTAKILNAYEGSTICVAGTQNTNGYTAFKDVLIEQYIEQKKADFDKVVQIPLPSFAGKDEALYVFEKKESSKEDV